MFIILFITQLIYEQKFREELHILSFRCFILYGKASGNCKFIIAQLSDPFLCTISTSTDSGYIKFDSMFIAVKLKA